MRMDVKMEMVYKLHIKYDVGSTFLTFITSGR